MARNAKRQSLNEAGTLVLDSGGLSHVANDRETAAIMRAFIDKGWHVVTAAPVLTESLRGDHHDAKVDRILSARVEVVPCDEDLARSSAPIRTQALRSAHPSATDAIVATLAIQARPSAVILTSDYDDLSALTDGQDHVRILRV